MFRGFVLRYLGLIASGQSAAEAEARLPMAVRWFALRGREGEAISAIARRTWESLYGAELLVIEGAPRG